MKTHNNMYMYHAVLFEHHNKTQVLYMYTITYTCIL